LRIESNSLIEEKFLYDFRCATRNIYYMIKSIKHNGLKRFYSTGSIRGIQSQHAAKLRMQLAALDTAMVIEDLDIPGYRLHQLQGQRKGIWSITVNANWRLTFAFIEGNVFLLNYEDYH
jgi:proteic killer suppression protein